MIAENPKTTELKEYKGFKVFKEETFTGWGKLTHYYAFRSIKGYCKDYISEVSTLKEVKQEIDYLIASES